MLCIFLLITIAAAWKPGEVVWACRGLRREVHLTYDDGPSNKTHALLDALKELQVKATFFVTGGNANLYPDTIRRMVLEGHSVGSHTWNHANLTALLDPASPKYDPNQFVTEIDKTERLLESLTGQKPSLFRPPYGAINEEVRAYLQSRGYTIFMWNSGCLDWWFQNGEQENTIYLAGMADTGALMCLHDGKYPDFVESTVQLIQMLRDTKQLPFANPQGRNIISLQQCNTTV